MITTRYLAAAVAAYVLGACGPAVVWSGRTADRERRIEVVEDAGLSYVIVDGHRRAAYHGVAGWSIALAGEHVAFAARVGDRWRVVVDGRPGPPWDEIGTLELSTNGEPVYAARRGRDWHVVRGSTSGPRFDGLFAGTLRMTGGHVAYVGQRGTRAHVVHDERIGPAFDGIGQLALSASGERAIYAGRRGDDAFVVVDGVCSRAWGAVRNLVLGPHGHRAYAASETTGWRLVVDDAVGPAVDAIYEIVFRDDGKHVAWVGRVGDVRVLSLDESPLAPVGRYAHFAFRPGATEDGELGLAYVLDTGASQRVVVDEREGPSFDEVGALVWSRDGKLAYTARRAGSWLVVYDGRELVAGERVGEPVFSPHGDRLGYVASRTGGTYVVVDGRPHRFDLAFEDSLAFSTDGQHWAVIAGDVHREQLFIAFDQGSSVELPAHEIYSAAARGDLGQLRAWTRAELARRQSTTHR